MTGVSWYDSLRFSIDWVNVTVQCPDVVLLIDELCEACHLDRAQWSMLPRGGFHWYHNTQSYILAGHSAITLSYCLDDRGYVPLRGQAQQNGILVSISGDGCRYLDTHTENGLRKFLQICAQYEYNCTRLDAAMDILDKDNPIVPLFTDFAPRAYDYEPDGHLMIKGNMQRKNGYVRYMPVYDPDFNAFTSNVYIGDRTSSKGHCCVYNKKVEVLTGRHSRRAKEMFADMGVIDYWYRIEYRAKNFTLANSSFAKIMEDDASAMDAFYYLADNMFTFVDLDKDIHNVQRCNENVIWVDFLGWCQDNLQNAHFVQLTAQRYVNKSVDDVCRWMQRMAAMVAKFELIKDLRPAFYARTYDEGIKKVRSMTQHRQFWDEVLVSDVEEENLYDTLAV